MESSTTSPRLAARAQSIAGGIVGAVAPFVLVCAFSVGWAQAAAVGSQESRLGWSIVMSAALLLSAPLLVIIAAITMGWLGAKWPLRAALTTLVAAPIAVGLGSGFGALGW